jgi:hypothetical protein
MSFWRLAHNDCIGAGELEFDLWLKSISARGSHHQNEPVAALDAN